MLQTEIDPDLVLGWDPWCIVLFDEEGDEELARLGHRHRRRPDDALKRAMLFELHEADFRKSHLAVLDADRAVLVVRRVGGARPPSRFEGREAARPGEELRERGVEIQLRVRERETVHLGEEREQGLVGGGCRRFPSRSTPRFRLLADGDAVLEQLVVDEPGAADRLDEELGLCRRWVEPIFIAFQHVRPSSLQKIMMCPPHPIPMEGRENLTESRTFVRHICHRGRRVLDRAIHLPPTLGYAPRRLEEGKFSPDLVKSVERNRMFRGWQQWTALSGMKLDCKGGAFSVYRVRMNYPTVGFGNSFADS